MAKTSPLRAVLVTGAHALALGLSLSFLLLAPKAVAQTPVAATEALKDFALGNPSAKVTLIEYASPTCPHCAAWNAETFPAFKSKYVDTGLVRYVFRELPTPPAEVAEAGFLLMRCAPEDKAFDVLHSLFDGQSTLRFTRKADILLYNAGAAGGLSRSQTEACLADKALRTKVMDRIEANIARDKVQYTPTFILNGVKIGEGELSFADLDRQLTAALAGKPVKSVTDKANTTASKAAAKPSRH